jgi:hypothetical protein
MYTNNVNPIVVVFFICSFLIFLGIGLTIFIQYLLDNSIIDVEDNIIDRYQLILFSFSATLIVSSIIGFIFTYFHSIETINRTIPSICLLLSNAIAIVLCVYLTKLKDYLEDNYNAINIVLWITWGSVGVIVLGLFITLIARINNQEVRIKYLEGDITNDMMISIFKRLVPKIKELSDPDLKFEITTGLTNTIQGLFSDESGHNSTLLSSMNNEVHETIPQEILKKHRGITEDQE